jgi:hypothetical protein
MLPLALGLTLDVYLIARVVFGTPGFGLAFAAALLLALMLLWTVLPRLEARKNSDFQLAASSLNDIASFA